MRIICIAVTDDNERLRLIKRDGKFRVHTLVTNSGEEKDEKAFDRIVTAYQEFERRVQEFIGTFDDRPAPVEWSVALSEEAPGPEAGEGSFYFKKSGDLRKDMFFVLEMADNDWSMSGITDSPEFVSACNSLVASAPEGGEVGVALYLK